MKEKIIGILGGMGPEATLDLAYKILRLTIITKEQDHCRLIIDNNPKIENRTEAIFSGRTEKVISQLSASAANLEKAGAGLILIPCNTAHYFIKSIRSAVGITVIDMIEETALLTAQKFPELLRAGILGTSATCRTGLYRGAFSKNRMELLEPGPRGQDKVMAAISLIKEKNGHKEAGAILKKNSGGAYKQGSAGNHRRLHRNPACA